MASSFLDLGITSSNRTLEEFCLLVYKTFDKPETGNAVNLGAFAGNPFHAESILRLEGQKQLNLGLRSYLNHSISAVMNLVRKAVFTQTSFF